MRLDCEIEMIVVPASGVERSVAMRAAGTRVEVVRDAQLDAAGAAKDSCRVPFGYRPWLDGVVGQSFMAVFARIKGCATFHFDGDNIERGVIVEAARLSIEIQAADFGNGWWHG